MALSSQPHRSFIPFDAPQYHYVTQVNETTRITIGDSDGTVAWSNTSNIIGPQNGGDAQLHNSSDNDWGCMVVSLSSTVTLNNGAVQAYVHQPQSGTQDMGMRLSASSGILGCSDTGWTTVFGYQEVGGPNSGGANWYGGSYTGDVRSIRIEVWSAGGNILHLNRYFYLDSVRVWGFSPLTLEVVDPQSVPVTAMGLNNDGWPTPNPLTTIVTISCPEDGPNCTAPFNLSISSNDNTRFYMYAKDLAADQDPMIISCQDFFPESTPYSHGSYLGICTRAAVPGSTTFTVLAGDTKTLRWQMWIQPSQAADLDFAATWGTNTITWTVQITSAQIHPLVFIPGYLGTWPSQHGGGLDPILHTYDNTIEFLQRAGYELGSAGSGASLTPLGWDWRFPLWHTGRYVLSGDIQAIQTTLPSIRKSYVNYGQVDMVAHSAGGLVARSYLEDISLTNTPANVHKMVTLATPHRGLPPAYRGWYGGDVRGAFGVEGAQAAGLLAGLIVCDRDDGSGASGAVHVITSGEMFDYIHSSMPSAEHLLPAPDVQPAYLLDYNTNAPFPFGVPYNAFLDDLNSAGGAWDATRLIGGLTIYSSFSSSEQTNIQYGVLPPPGGGSSLWQYGIAVLPPKGRGPGDSFVPAYSANLKQVAALAGAGNIYERGENSILGEAFNHSTIVSNPRMVRQVLFYLSGLQADEQFWNVDPPTEPGFLGSAISVFSCSPVRILVTDPLGRQAGLNMTTGQVINQIPGAYVSTAGDEPQQIIIPGTTLGLYRVNGIGVATGPYKVGAAYATADRPDFLTQVFSGTTVLNQSYQFTFNIPLSISTYLPIILKEATGQSMITAPGGDDGASDSPFVSPVPTPTPAKKKVR